MTTYLSGQEPDFWDPRPSEMTHRNALGNTAHASPSNPPLIAICMNPSYADEGRADRTVNRLIDASRAHGYSGWIMLNLYPERSTNPSGLSAFDPVISAANCAAIERVLSEYEATEVLGAWGFLSRATLRRAKVDVLATLKRLDVRLFSFANPTADGEPRHPLPRDGSNPLMGNKRYLT